MLFLNRLPLFLLACALSLALLDSGAAHAVGRGAQGFGASSQGGQGGQVLLVTRLDDSVKKAPPGTLRWALKQKGPRIIKFAVGGTIQLRDRIEVTESRVTIDGTDAPDEGITIRGGSLEFERVEDVILRNLRIRLGDENILRKNREEKRKRPRSSNGLDCITLKDCNRVLIDRCSLSWSCDELIGITHCQNVTVQWCILSEPLGRPELHPYGDDHAFGLNASASTLSIHHCLFARFAMRGPQFECNDMRPKDKYTVQMEAVNNVIFDYQRSGSRYSTGVEKGSGTAEGKKFEFQFLNNLYVSAGAKRKPIEAFTKHGHVPGLKAAVVGNEEVTGLRQKIIAGIKLPAFSIKGPHLNWPMDRAKPVSVPSLEEEMQPAPPSLEPLPQGTSAVSGGGQPIPVPEKAVTRRLFAAPFPVRPEPVAISWRNVLNAAGAGPVRDYVDARIMRDVEEMIFRDTLKSQKEVEGWP